MPLTPPNVARIDLPWSPSLPLGLAFVVGILWLTVDVVLRWRLPKSFGTKEDEDGVPRYRCVSGFATQLVFLPCLFLLSLASSGFSISAWSQRAGAAYFTEDGSRFYDWAFCYVFAAYMLTDVVVLKHLSILLKLHHIGCVLGLAIGFAGLPSGFPLFAAGVFALELGSAALNVYCLYPHRHDCLYAYVVVMTISNCVGALCCALWIGYAGDPSLTTQAAVVGLMTVFIVIRQKTAIEMMAKHGAHAARAKEE